MPELQLNLGCLCHLRIPRTSARLPLARAHQACANEIQFVPWAVPLSFFPCLEGFKTLFAQVFPGCAVCQTSLHPCKESTYRDRAEVLVQLPSTEAA